MDSVIEHDRMSLPSCKNCCRKCLYWWSSRCPHGLCYDDYRAKHDPYEKRTGHHRTSWSNCEMPGEQDHWCRGGSLFPIDPETACKSFIPYTGQMVRTCLKANISEFQDGYIDCNIINTIGCKACYEEFERMTEEGEQ